MDKTIRVTRLTTTLQKTIGLLGKKQPESVLFETRFGIHTFGMQFPIDVVILSDTYRVEKFHQGLMPNRIFVWNPRYRYVLELPSGKINALHIHLGDKLRLIEQ